jgi:hypothetical protein
LVINGNHLGQVKDFLFDENINGTPVQLNLLQLCAHYKCNDAVKNLAEAKLDDAKAFDVYEGDAKTLPLSLALNSDSAIAAKTIIENMQNAELNSSLPPLDLKFNILSQEEAAKHFKSIHQGKKVEMQEYQYDYSNTEPISGALHEMYSRKIKVSYSGLFPESKADIVHLMAAKKLLYSSYADKMFETADTDGTINKQTEDAYTNTPAHLAAHNLNAATLFKLVELGAHLNIAKVF